MLRLWAIKQPHCRYCNLLAEQHNCVCRSHLFHLSQVSVPQCGACSSPSSSANVWNASRTVGSYRWVRKCTFTMCVCCCWAVGMKLWNVKLSIECTAPIVSDFVSVVVLLTMINTIDGIGFSYCAIVIRWASYSRCGLRTNVSLVRVQNWLEKL